VKLTGTQTRPLAAASRRDDRALERPSNLTGVSAGKVVAKLLIEGLVEECNPAVRCRCTYIAHTLRISEQTGGRARASARSRSPRLAGTMAFGVPPQGLRSPARHLLYRMIAYRLQADRLGDLDRDNQRFDRVAAGTRNGEELPEGSDHPRRHGL
jgi:hypothetical protein